MEGGWNMTGSGSASTRCSPLESRLEDSLARLRAETRELLEAPVIIGDLHVLVTGHRQTLAVHRRELGDTGAPQAPAAVAALLDAPLEEEHGRDVVARLENIAVALAQAAVRYELFHGFAHRSYQLATADLADRHRVDYLRAAQAVHQSLGDVVVQELQTAGLTCRCRRPSCSPGVCLCWHAHLEAEATGPGVSREGIVVREPRPDSDAEHTGLRHGDVILAVEGNVIDSYQDMLDRMREHEPGEEVELSVRRRNGELEQVMLTR